MIGPRGEPQDLRAQAGNLSLPADLCGRTGNYQSVRRRAIGEHSRRERDAQGAVDNDAQRIATPDQSDAELRIVSQHGSDPDHYRIVLAPELMREAPRPGAAYPLRIPGGGRYSTVEGLSELHGDEGTTGGRVFDHKSGFSLPQRLKCGPMVPRV